MLGFLALGASFLGYLATLRDKTMINHVLEDQGVTYLDDIYRQYGTMNGLDWKILKAIATVESNENPGAAGSDGKSFGLMQVRCDASCPGCKCHNNLNVVGWSEATPERLTDPDYNVKIAAQVLAWNMEHYGYERGIAVYNSWAARNDPANGPFRNQSYVDKVLGVYSGL